MVREGMRINPVAVLVHAIGIALGLFLGWTVMTKVTPDFPGESVEPGVRSSAVPTSVAGDDPDSLFRAENLGPALTQLDQQMTAGEGIVSLHIEPGSLESAAASGDRLFEPSDVSPEAPALLTSEINSQRGRTIDLGKIAYMDLVATDKGPRWFVQLDIDQEVGPPPWTYNAPLEGSPLKAGGSPPEQAKP